MISSTVFLQCCPPFSSPDRLLSSPLFFVRKMAKWPFLAVQSCLVLIQGWIAKEPTGMEKDCINMRMGSILKISFISSARAGVLAVGAVCTPFRAVRSVSITAAGSSGMVRCATCVQHILSLFSFVACQPRSYGRRTSLFVECLGQFPQNEGGAFRPPETSIWSKASTVLCR